MQLSVSDHGDHFLAKADGALDETLAEPFRQLLYPIVGQSGAKLIIDISGSPRINSTGIACLVRLVTDANAKGSRVVLAAPTAFVANVFNVTKLTRFFEIVDDLSEAKSRL